MVDARSVSHHIVLVDRLRLALTPWLAGIRQRAVRLVASLDVGMDGLITAWVGVMFLAAFAKVMTAPLPAASIGDWISRLLPFLLAALAPIAGYRIATASFPRNRLSAQPSFRLARYGRWRRLDVVEARQKPEFGPTGFMASLLVGILLNVPVRTFEYLTAVPAIGPNAPDWVHVLVQAMTLDVVVMNFLYMVCFVMALRSIPLFPRTLLYAWAVDIGMQFMIAQRVAHSPGLPPDVASALLHLLNGNLDKVFISAAIWLPYLILSERVNVTYRQRSRMA